MARKPKAPTEVKTHRHQDKRPNIPPAEMEPLMAEEDKSPIRVAYARRNRDLDPQLVWRGKDERDWSDLVVQAPPLYIQEKVHPKVLIDDLLRETAERKEQEAPDTPDLFGDFNGLPDAEAAAEFYQHQANWTNRMILGDSLSVMASLAEREGLRGKVQCIYLDPPYGIKFNSNFQWSTTSRDVKDGNANHVTREPEMVKAFRDTWRDGIHSYLTYLRDRLTVARDLLHESGSVFVQIGDENLHRVRSLMDEVFGDENFVSEIKFKTTSNRTSEFIPTVFDTILFYAKNRFQLKFRRPLRPKDYDDVTEDSYGCVEINQNEWRRLSKSEKNQPKQSENIGKLFGLGDLTSSHEYTREPFNWFGQEFGTKKRYWSTSPTGLERLGKANRLCNVNGTLRYKRIFRDTYVIALDNIWRDLGSGSQTEDRTYVVQTISKAVERCMLMATDPGDLVLDPTCGSGTTAYVAEQWGRRWITIDTSRVALALARARIMGARFPYYHLRDTEAGVRKEAELKRVPPSEDRLSEVKREGHKPDIRQGFVYERVPHITLKSIANNAEIDVIWDQFQEKLEPLRQRLNAALGQSWEDWEIPLEASEDWSDDALEAHAAWWEQRIARQKEIDASIAAKADHEYLYDKPYTDNTKIRVAGPFTVESLSPHRTLAVDHDDELVDTLDAAKGDRDAPGEESDFATMVMENLKTSGVQQMQRGDRIAFSALTPWPGRFIAAEGRYREGEDGPERRAGIFIGPEFGTVQRADLTAAARECAEAGFDILVACAFSYAAQCTDLTRMGALPVLRARMNPDLHMADDLKNTGAGNLFVVFGEPDIDLIPEGDQVRVKTNGVDVFKPQTGEIESSGPEGIACWFIDTDYNEESFFVRHAYFLGAGDPYKALKTTLKAEIDAEAWESLHADLSRPFDKPRTGRIAVKVINHLGDEVMKVFRV
ncbi:MAG: site-specific DNA-methyltransferase [Pseudomonadota bacterium]